MLRCSLILALIACGLTACEKQPAQPAIIEKVSVVATVYPLADLARQVGGSHVDVAWVIENGQTLTNADPGEQMRNRLRSADLVLASGASEPWAASGMGDPLQHNRVIRLDALESMRDNPSAVGYLWLDPILAQEASRELCRRLMAMRPRLESQLRAQSDQFNASVNDLTREYQRKLANAGVKNLIVLSPDFDVLLRRFSLLPVLGAVVSPTQVNDSAMRAIKLAGEENHTRLLIVPADTPPAVVRDLQARGALQVVLIDCFGSSAAGGHNSYLDLMRFNLEQLYRATTVQ